MAGLTPDGVLVVDKPCGPTSHDIVAQARKVFSTRSVGHAGTLDPMASGVLVLMFGEAKKLSAYLTAHDKSYCAEVAFGRSTDTLDGEGVTVHEQPLPEPWPPQQRLSEALRRELARTVQVPPSVSAIKVSGRAAHRRVRAGESLELAERPVKVHALELVRITGARATIELRVSKGYYVRAFARDLGDALDVPAHLSQLRRTRSGPWSLANAVSWPVTTPPPLISTKQAALACLPSANLNAPGALRARQGKPLEQSDFSMPPGTAGVNVWLDPEGHLVALGSEQEPGEYRVVRGFKQG